HQKKRAFY
ncbi:bacterial extracellular solute-binding s, 3 family protein, partial [Vibrio parahaemolyticus V-223/04]